MAPRSLNVGGLVFVVYMLMLVPTAVARMGAVAEVPKDIPLNDCTTFVSESAKCMTDVFTNAAAPHPSCCQAFAELNQCSPQLLKAIPPVSLDLIRKVCELMGVSIP